MKTLTFAFAIGILTTAQTLWAGPSSGGGGMVVTCKNEAGIITSTDLLDVYEAKQNPKLKVMQPTGDLAEDYLRTVNHTYILQGAPGLAQSRKKQINENLNGFMGIVDWVDALPFLNDQGEMTVKIPDNCKLEQLAIFYDSKDRVSIDKNIWARLDTVSRAALVQHEIFYHFERKFSEKTSESTRSYVRQNVTTEGFTPVVTGLENSLSLGSAYDEANNNNLTVFHIRNDLDPKHLTLQFTQIGGRALLVQTIVQIPDLVLSVKCIINGNNERVCYPTTQVNMNVRLPVITEHRKDWEILFKYVAGEPVKITLIQRGAVLSTSVLTSLSK